MSSLLLPTGTYIATDLYTKDKVTLNAYYHNRIEGLVGVHAVIKTNCLNTIANMAKVLLGLIKSSPLVRDLSDDMLKDMTMAIFSLPDETYRTRTIQYTTEIGLLAAVVTFEDDCSSCRLDVSVSMKNAMSLHKSILDDHDKLFGYVETTISSRAVGTNPQIH